MALETPDIALVIGPPGTGKTQVIAALTKRLAEIVGQTNSQHQILITSFQHDAVENALDRSQVYDLPSVKIGRESDVVRCEVVSASGRKARRNSVVARPKGWTRSTFANRGSVNINVKARATCHRRAISHPRTN